MVSDRVARVGTGRRATAWTVLGLLLASTALVACGGDEAAQPEWVEELNADDARSQVSISPSESTATTVVARPGGDDPPTVDATGDDFDRIWREIEAFETWLLGHPDEVDRLDEIYVDDRPIYGQTRDLLDDLSSMNAVMVVGNYEIVSVELVERLDDDTAKVRYSDSRDDREFVEVSTGEVLDREEYGDQPWTWDLTLERGDDGRWRIADIVFVDDPA